MTDTNRAHVIKYMTISAKELRLANKGIINGGYMTPDEIIEHTKLSEDSMNIINNTINIVQTSAILDEKMKSYLKKNHERLNNNFKKMIFILSQAILRYAI